MLPQRKNSLKAIRVSTQMGSRVRATRRLAQQYLRSEEIRWRLLVLVSRYTSHIAIVSVALLAIVLAGARMTSPPHAARSVQANQDPAGPNGAPLGDVAPGVAPGVALGMGIEPDGAAVDGTQPVDGAPSATGPLSRRGSGAVFSPQLFQTYAALNNQDGGLLSRLAVTGTVKPVDSRAEIITYTVQPGDTIEAIAVRFGLQPTTLVWSNEDVEETPDRLDIGQLLYVLPLDGIWYTVQADDTLDSIAEKFKAKTEDIIGSPLNALSNGSNLLPGQKLVVPKGVKPFVPRAVEEPSGSYAASAYSGAPVDVAANGTFQWPTNGYISQGYWWGHQALDIANAVGIPIGAADSGYVSFAGWDGTGYGYMVMINHGNGYATVYAHLSAYYVDPGQPVARGQIIAAMGSTGRSTGPHLHFEIRYGGVLQNPLYYLP